MRDISDERNGGDQLLLALASVLHAVYASSGLRLFQWAAWTVWIVTAVVTLIVLAPLLGGTH